MNFKKYTPHLIALLAFLLVNVIAFTPAFSGKVVQQSDIVAFNAVTKELKDYETSTGKNAQWTNSLFGGMPAYQIIAVKKGNQLALIDRAPHAILPHPTGMFFIAMVACYILLILLGANPWLSAVGAIAFAMATNNIVLFEAGHNSKVRALSYFPLIIAGILLALRKKYLLGGMLFALGMGLSILVNHPQMLYYLGLTIPVVGIAALVDAIRNNTLPDFAKSIGILVVGLLVALGAGANNVLPTLEFSAETMRGEPILESSGEEETFSSSDNDGLSFQYAMNWSNGWIDLAATFVPGAAGGANIEPISRDSPYGRALTRLGARLPDTFDVGLYHGNLPFTSGPIYLGAVIWFLFVLGILMVRGPVFWWMVGGTIITFMLSMGSELAWFNRFLYDNLPLFNKWRSPSSTLTITILFMATLGMLGLRRWSELLSSNAAEARKKLFIAAGITGVAALIMALIGPSMTDLSAGPRDLQSIQAMTGGQGGQQTVDTLLTALEETRAARYTADAWRSLIFVLLSAGVLFLWSRKTITMSIAAVALGVLVLADFMPISGRYLNKSEDFVTKRRSESRYQPTAADQQILADSDPHFRVYNTTVGNPFEDASTSYFHKSLGGYHPAKLQRIQDLIDRHLSKGNQQVFNMLNTKYIITSQEQAQQNPGALGNAWLVSNIQQVPNANAEIDALESFDAATTAVVHQEFADAIAGLAPNGQGTVSLTSYAPDELNYTFNSSAEQLVVFSEMWYGPNKGWEATIDGQPAELIRANYGLRALRVPAGSHQIAMVFDPPAYRRGIAISLVCSSLLLLGLLAYVYLQYRNQPPVAPVTPPAAPVQPTAPAKPEKKKSPKANTGNKPRKRKKK